MIGAALAAQDNTTYMIGVDVSTAVSEKEWACLKTTKEVGPVELAVVRLFTSVGKLDPNGVATIKNAIKAGIPYVNSYIFPCVKCGNPA